MNYSSAGFTRLCQGEDIDIRYRDTFIHYRFLKNPEQKPDNFQSPSPLTKVNRKLNKMISKAKRFFS